MVSTRSTRSRVAAAAAEDPVVERPMVGGSAPRRRKSRAPAPRKQLPTMEEPKTTVEEENGDAGAVDKMELDRELVEENIGPDEATGEADRVMNEVTVDENVHANDSTLEADGTMGEAANGDAHITGEAPAIPSTLPEREVPKDSLLVTQATPTKSMGDPAAGGFSEVEIRRSGRKRVAPTMLDEASATKVKAKAGAGAGAKASEWRLDGDDDSDDADIMDEDSEWEEEYLMTNPKSIYGSNLQDFFNVDVWNQLSDSDKTHLMKFLPECDKVYEPTSDISDPTAPKAELVDDFWDKNPQLVNRIFQVETDIADGKYTPANQAAVIEARKRSEAGEFNQFKDNKFEQFWGQKQRVNYEAVAGDTSGVKLQTLVKHHALRVGDVFSLRRSFAIGEKKKKSDTITIEKDAKLTAIDPENFSLTFSYPPGKLQVSSDHKPDKIISNVVSMTAFENLLCREDGRIKGKLPNGNAFKTFRIKRNEQDIGSLFDIRTEFHAKYLSPKAD